MSGGHHAWSASAGGAVIRVTRTALGEVTG